MNITDSELMILLGKSKSTFYAWKKREPVMYRLVKRAIFLDKLIKNMYAEAENG
jgi:predicted DNA-binding transcriptional regulator AlpA